MTTYRITAISVALVAGALLVATANSEANGPKPPNVIVPAGTAKFTPLDPKAPDGPQVSIISGDPKTGPVAFLFKRPRGVVPLHWHTSDYYAVIVEGTAKHWLAGQSAPAAANRVGTAWAQPGGSPATAHGDECTSDSCTIFIYMPKGIDLTPVTTAGGK